MLLTLKPVCRQRIRLFRHGPYWAAANTTTATHDSHSPPLHCLLKHGKLGDATFLERALPEAVMLHSLPCKRFLLLNIHRREFAVRDAVTTHAVAVKARSPLTPIRSVCVSPPRCRTARSPRRRWKTEELSPGTI